MWHFSIFMFYQNKFLPETILQSHRRYAAQDDCDCFKEMQTTQAVFFSPIQECMCRGARPYSAALWRYVW